MHICRRVSRLCTLKTADIEGRGMGCMASVIGGLVAFSGVEQEGLSSSIQPDRQLCIGIEIVTLSTHLV